MSLGFRKSFKIAPGIRLNVGKKGVSSVSLGGRGAKVNISKKGTRSTVSAPGTGLSFSSYKPHAKQNDISSSGQGNSNPILNIIIGLVVVFFLIWLIA